METMYTTPDAPQTDLFLEEPVVPASFGERFLAVLIDGIILAVANFVLEIVLDNISSSVLSIVVGWLYFAIQESGEQQATIGKKVLGLKVTTIDGQRMSFGQATGRHFGKIISGIILLIGYFMMLWDEKKQTLHDKMAGALVVKR